MKKIALLLMCVFAVSAVSAQSGVNKSSNKHANWTVSVGAGAQYYWNSTRSLGETSDHITPQIEVAVGKWFTPVWGIRLGANGYNFKGYTLDANNPFIDKGNQTKFNYMNVHVDVMFDMFSAVCQCKYRFYELIPYAGAGLAFSSKDSEGNQTSWSINGGIINRFRVSDHFDINLNLNAMLVDKKFDNDKEGNWKEGSLGATLGVTYKF